MTAEDSETVELWLLARAPDDATAVDAARRCEAVLDEGERARLATLADGGRRLEFVLGHALARHALSRHAPGVAAADWRIAAASGGRPFAQAAGVVPADFNIAHTRGLVAAAVSPASVVGVDVERTDRTVDVRRLAARFFAAEEVSALCRLPPPERGTGFLACWTLKEACLKARGSGLREPLRGVVFEPPAAARVLCAGVEGRMVIGRSSQPAPASVACDGGWRFALLADGDRHLVALAVALPPAALAAAVET